MSLESRFNSKPSVTDRQANTGWMHVKTLRARITELEQELSNRDARLAPQNKLQGSTREALTRFALDSSVAAMFTVNKAGCFIDVNTSACRNLGYTREELLQLSVPDISPSVTNEDWPARWAYMKDQGATVLRQEHRRKDGRVFPVEVTTTFFHYRGQEMVCAFVYDITERLRAEEALLESEQFNRTLFEQSPIGQSLARMDGTLVYINHSFARILGRPKDQILGSTFWSFTPERFHPEGQHAMEQLAVLGRFPAYDKEYIHGNGHLVPVRVSGCLINQNGRSLVLANVQDITEEKRAKKLEVEAQATLERKVKERTQELSHAVDMLSNEVAVRRQTEVELAEAKERLHSVISSNPMLIYTCHIDDDVYSTTFMSENCMSISGYPAERFIADPGFWIDHVHPDDRESVLLQMEELVNHGGGDLEYRFLHGDGRYRLIKDTARIALDEHGKPSELVGCWHDMTRQREAEQQFRLVQSAVNNISDAVMIVDARIDGHGPYIVYVNPAFKKLSGYTQEELIGKPSRLMRGYGTNEDDRQRLDKAICCGETYSGVVTNYRKGGGEYIVDWRACPIKDKDENVTHWVVIQKDITEKLRNQVLLRQHEIEMEHVTRLSMMGEMASGLAHELNQPLAAIQNYANGALRRIDDSSIYPTKSITEALNKISMQADRSGKIIRRMRDFVARRVPRRSTIYINNLIQDVLGLAETELIGKSTRVVLNFEEDTPPVYGDHVQIEQVMMNLIRNAIAAMEDMPTDDRVIEITTRSEGNDSVTVLIRDYGKGLDQDGADQIFHPFYTTKEGGIGMGLTISRTIVESHGGSLSVVPPEGTGACFQVTFLCSGNTKT